MAERESSGFFTSLSGHQSPHESPLPWPHLNPNYCPYSNTSLWRWGLQPMDFGGHKYLVHSPMVPLSLFSLKCPMPYGLNDPVGGNKVSFTWGMNLSTYHYFSQFQNTSTQTPQSPYISANPCPLNTPLASVFPSPSIYFRPFLLQSSKPTASKPFLFFSIRIHLSSFVINFYRWKKCRHKSNSVAHQLYDLRKVP